MATTRKPMGKKLRFDVFKRDGFKCQYCGAHPPSAILEVDHINPVALGGENDIDNLVTACFACNRGKAAVSLKVVPQSLADKVAAVSEREDQMQGYHAVLEAKRERLEDQAWMVLEEMGVDRVKGCSRDQFNSTRMFVEKLGYHATLEAMEIAMGASITYSRVFKYFCGICWNKVREQEASNA